MPQRWASSLMTFWAARLVPTNSTLLLLAASLLTNVSASLNSGRVFSRLMIWILLRAPKMNGFIFGFQKRVWWPKCTPALSMSRMVTLVIVFLRLGWASLFPRASTRLLAPVGEAAGTQRHVSEQVWISLGRRPAGTMRALEPVPRRALYTTKPAGRQRELRPSRSPHRSRRIAQLSDFTGVSPWS